MYFYRILSWMVMFFVAPSVVAISTVEIPREPIAARVPAAFCTKRLRAERIVNSEAHMECLRCIHGSSEIQDVWVGSLAACTTDEEREALSKARRAFGEYAPNAMGILTQQWENHGYGVYTFFDSATGAFMGNAGYHATVINEKNEVVLKHDDPAAEGIELELYIGLLPAYWRQGYAAEIIMALVRKAAEHLPAMNVIVYIKPTNNPSLGLVDSLRKLNPAVDVEVVEGVLSEGEEYRLYRVRPPVLGTRAVGS